MTGLALLCGLFYGALFYSAWEKEVQRRRLERLVAGVWKAIDEAAWEPCDCTRSERIKSVLQQCECCSPSHCSTAQMDEHTSWSHTGTEDG